MAKRTTDRTADRPTTEREPSAPAPPEPPPASQPAYRGGEADSHAGRPDQDVKHTLGPGAGGATEWGGGNKNHPSRIKGRPPGT